MCRQCLEKKGWREVNKATGGEGRVCAVRDSVQLCNGTCDCQPRRRCNRQRLLQRDFPRARVNPKRRRALHERKRERTATGLCGGVDVEDARADRGTERHCHGCTVVVHNRGCGQAWKKGRGGGGGAVQMSVSKKAKSDAIKCEIMCFG